VTSDPDKTIFYKNDDNTTLKVSCNIKYQKEAELEPDYLFGYSWEIVNSSGSTYSLDDTTGTFINLQSNRLDTRSTVNCSVSYINFYEDLDNPFKERYETYKAMDEGDEKESERKSLFKDYTT
jgi:hypothetical protein